MMLEGTLCTTVGEHPMTLEQRGDYEIYWFSNDKVVVGVTNHFYNWI